jgi:energy-coupling factor transporter ATP-binding protein EcfA2
MPIRFKFGQHWAIIGGTGSGKTTLAKMLLGTVAKQSNGQVPIYILDSKISGDFTAFHQRGVGVLHTGNILPPIHDPQKFGAFQVWQPLDDDIDLYDAYFKQIYSTRSPAIIFIDELSSITSRAGSPPRYYEILLKQGRGNNQSVITLTQSSTWVPPSLLRQVMHTVLMRVNSINDVKKMVPLLGQDAFDEIKHDHGFLYRDVSKPRHKNPTEYYENLQEFFGI